VARCRRGFDDPPHLKYESGRGCLHPLLGVFKILYCYIKTYTLQIIKMVRINGKSTKKGKQTKKKGAPPRAPKAAAQNARQGQNSEDSALACYKAALDNPFSTRAQGARVPDMYCVPTSTRHITRSFTLTSNASGELDAVCLPSAYHHVISPKGNLVGSGNWQLLDGTTVTNGLGYTDKAAFAQQLTNYRIVGWGIQIMGTAAMTNNQGKIIVAKVPIASNLNTKADAVGGITPNINNANATAGNTLSAYGIPNYSNAVNTPALANLNDSFETTMVAISEKPKPIFSKITSPEAFTFRESTDNAIGYNITDQSSLTNVQTGDASYMRVSGFEAIVIGAAGLPASTAVMELQITYHLEGTPFISANGNSFIAGDSAQVSVNPMGWMKVIAQVAREDSFKTIVGVAGNTFYPGLGTFAKRFL